MPTLWIASHRVPKIQNEAASGGLVTALSPFFNASVQNQPFDSIIFCGFADDPTETVSNQFDIEHFPNRPNIARYVLPISREEHESCYKGYMSVLWALHHGLIDKIDPQSLKYFSNYIALQRRMAHAMAPHIKSDDLIWCQDYQTLMLTQALRDLGIFNKIGHFNHIPEIRRKDLFDLSAAMRAPLNRQLSEIMNARTANDLIGLQRQSDVVHFLEHRNIFRLPPDIYDAKIPIDIAGTSVKIGVFPASIDVDADKNIAAMPLTPEERQEIGYLPDKGPIIMTAGRLDISKNYPALYNAVRDSLRDPNFVAQIRHMYGANLITPLHFYGIATPTRAGVFGYAEEGSDTETAYQALVSEQGSQISTLNRTGLKRSTLLKLLRLADGCFPSRRDGQLLLGPEHVVAQDPDDPRVLIISQEAGAADILPGAIKVDPHDPLDLQRALKMALTMPRGERIQRYDGNFHCVGNHSVKKFAKRFIEALIR